MNSIKIALLRHPYHSSDCTYLSKRLEYNHTCTLWHLPCSYLYFNLPHSYWCEIPIRIPLLSQHNFATETITITVFFPCGDRGIHFCSDDKLSKLEQAGSVVLPSKDPTKLQSFLEILNKRQSTKEGDVFCFLKSIAEVWHTCSQNVQAAG